MSINPCYAVNSGTYLDHLFDNPPYILFTIDDELPIPISLVFICRLGAGQIAIASILVEPFYQPMYLYHLNTLRFLTLKKDIIRRGYRLPEINKKRKKKVILWRYETDHKSSGSDIVHSCVGSISEQKHYLSFPLFLSVEWQNKWTKVDHKPSWLIMNIPLSKWQVGIGFKQNSFEYVSIISTRYGHDRDTTDWNRVTLSCY